ncbi:MAG: ABC transporter ATP-binding protein [Bradymonadaceae bacterium]|nr:ABC transporter ATP-binding protein [Lujinxingiaceae bacterium]
MTPTPPASEPAKAVLSIKGLTKRYRRLVAVDNIDIEVYPGDFVGFIGPNGAGKSTTMNCVSGVLAHDAGTIKVAGVDVLAAPVEAREHIGFVPQELALYGYLTGEEFLRFVGSVRGLSEEAQSTQIEELLTLTELTAARDRVLKEYSGGMARKIAICAALLGPPELLLLDESFVGLDPESTYRIRRRLERHCQEGGAILLSSHILEMLERVCTRFVIMSKGTVAKALTRTELDAAVAAGEYEDLTQLYLRVTGKDVALV